MHYAKREIRGTGTNRLRVSLPALLLVLGALCVRPAAAAHVPIGGGGSGLPSGTARNIYITQTACRIAGTTGFGLWVLTQGATGWAVYTCYPRYFSGDDSPWYQLYTNP